MSLTRKFLLFNTSLISLIAVLGSAAIWQIAAAGRDTRGAAAEYAVMDHAQSAATQVSWLRTNLSGADARVFRDAQYIQPLRHESESVLRELENTPPSEAFIQRAAAQDAIRHLDAAAKVFATGTAASAGQPDAAAAELEQAEKSLTSLATLAPAAARRQITATATTMHERLLWMCGWLLAVLGVSSFIHLRQYRALVKPLVWLRDDMRQSAAREFSTPVKARGDGEFHEVAGYFNGLARDLAQLYKSLEEKVIARSRELVRSERLASVGFLAAGVAHEINNPLSVISGYAELAGKDLRLVLSGEGAGTEATAETDAEAIASALQAQEIIREEAFRCKEITSRLLSLARGGGDGRIHLSLTETAKQVAALTRGLRHYRNRRVVTEFPGDESLPVVANPTEMKQVLLNLMVNALEATPSDRGIVRVGGKQEGAWVELYVEDNGKGMTPEVLEQIFEPFFTAKRGANEPGTGLGLSITHAIIESHGGRIRVTSDGPEKGSRFTLVLPLAPTLNHVNGKNAMAMRG